MRRTFAVLTVLLAVLICVPAHGQAAYKLLNAGPNASQYDVVILHPTTANAFTTTATANHAKVLGVLAEDVANGASGVVLLPGSIATVRVLGAITQADFLVTSTTAGAVSSAASSASGIIGLAFNDALTGATVRCMIMGPTVLAATNDLTINNLQVNGTLDVVGAFTAGSIASDDDISIAGDFFSFTGAASTNIIKGADANSSLTLYPNYSSANSAYISLFGQTAGSVTQNGGISLITNTEEANAFAGNLTFANYDGAAYRARYRMLKDGSHTWYDGLNNTTMSLDTTGALDVVGAFTAGSIVSDAGITATGDLLVNGGDIGNAGNASMIQLVDVTGVQITGTLESVSSATLAAATLGTAANGSIFAADGRQTMTGTGRVAACKVIDAKGIKLGGSNDPAASQIGFTPVYLFDSNADEEVFAGYCLPGSYEDGTDIKPHIHWAPTTAAAGDVHWKIDWYFSRGNNSELLSTPGGGATTADIAVDSTNSTQDEHLITAETTISGTGVVSGDMLHLRVWRDVSDADTYAADAAFASVHVVWMKNAIGSDTQW